MPASLAGRDFPTPQKCSVLEKSILYWCQRLTEEPLCSNFVHFEAWPRLGPCPQFILECDVVEACDGDDPDWQEHSKILEACPGPSVQLPSGVPTHQSSAPCCLWCRDCVETNPSWAREFRESEFIKWGPEKTKTDHSGESNPCCRVFRLAAIL